MGNGRMDAEILTRDRQGEPESAVDAVERVLDAGQRLVSERIELARLDAQEAMAGTLWHALSVGFTVLAGLTGWWAMVAAVVFAFRERVPLAASLAVVGLCHVLGAAVILVAMRRGTIAADSGRAS